MGWHRPRGQSPTKDIGEDVDHPPTENNEVVEADVASTLSSKRSENGSSFSSGEYQPCTPGGE